MTNLVALLSGALVNSGATVSFKLKKLSESKLQMVIHSSLGAIPEDANEQLSKMYYALSLPLVCEGSANEINDALEARIGGYEGVVKDCIDSIEEMKKQLAAAKISPTKKKSINKSNNFDKNSEQENEEDEDDSLEVPQVDVTKSVFNSDDESESDNF